MDEVAERADEGGRSLAISVLLHACVLGLVVLAPPEPPGISLDDVSTAPMTMRWATVMSAEPAEAVAPLHSPSLSHSPSRSLSPSRSPSPSPSRSRSTDVLAPLASLAHALDAVARPAFVAADALAALDDAGPLDLRGDGPDMVGTGRGAGGGSGDTIDQSGDAFGLGSIGATCTEAELVRRAGRMGRVAAVASCTADRNAGLVGVGGIGSRTLTRVPEAIDPHRVIVCGGHCWSNVDVGGALSREAVRRVVARHRAEISYCYERALALRPDLEGRVTARWTITPDGRVQGAALDAARSDVRAGELEACVTSAVARWTFPTASGPTIVSYPFVLGRAR